MVGLGRRRAALAAFASFVAGAAPAAVAETSGGPTKILKGAFGAFVVRPSVIVPTGDGSAVFGGPRRPHQPFGHLTWKRWGKANANARGLYYIEHCSPGPCNHTYSRSRVKLHAWRPVAGRFTRLTANGPRIHKTLSLYRQGSYWFWTSP